MSLKIPITVLVFLAMLLTPLHAADGKRLVVSPDGDGDFTNVQAAISSLSDSSSVPRLIFIRKGIYKEKIYLEKQNVVLEGENRDSVILTAAVARDEWRCSHEDDWGAATMNVEADDITFINLTVVNNYGRVFTETRNIRCMTDPLEKKKAITPASHQMAVRTFSGTRFKAINCCFRSYGGDTMSPWNVKEGMFYFKDCIMEGAVDLYCPRGWAYAENCTFIALRGEAVIWHDGSFRKDARSVFNKCSFDGYDGFQLGRYHRDAQIYFFHCTFSSSMADKPVFRVKTDNVIRWGHRVFFYNCHRIGGDYAWFGNNIDSEENSVPENINADWVFGNKWNPLKN